MKKIIGILVLIVLVLPTMVFGRMGTGINLGKIYLEEPLKAGAIYQLPEFTIINTGNEPSYYRVGVEYHQGQPEIQPPREWFKFTPQEFFLEPGQGQIVKTQLTAPLRAEPGKYFAYLEGKGLIKDVAGGGAAIGVAAAAQLYFTIAPGNIFLAVYYRLSAIYKAYYPWSLIILIILGLAVFIAIFKKFFKFRIGISRK